MPLIALAVVLLQAGEIAVGDGDHFLAGGPLRRGDRFEPHVLRLVAGRVESRDAGRSAAALAVIDAFDFGDAAEFDAQPQAHQQHGAGLAHGAHEGHLAELGVGEDVLVVAEALGRSSRSRRRRP